MVAEVFTTEFNLSVKKLETFSKVKLAGNINEAEFSDNALTLAVAYGLTVQAMGFASVNTDLMPPEIIKEAMWKTKQYWFVGAAACLLLAAGALWMRGLGDASAVQTDKDQIQQVMSSVPNIPGLKANISRIQIWMG